MEWQLYSAPDWKKGKNLGKGVDIGLLIFESLTFFSLQKEKTESQEDYIRSLGKS